MRARVASLLLVSGQTRKARHGLISRLVASCHRMRGIMRVMSRGDCSDSAMECRVLAGGTPSPPRARCSGSSIGENCPSYPTPERLRPPRRMRR